MKNIISNTQWLAAPSALLVCLLSLACCLLYFYTLAEADESSSSYTHSLSSEEAGSSSSNDGGYCPAGSGLEEAWVIPDSAWGTHPVHCDWAWWDAEFDYNYMTDYYSRECGDIEGTYLIADKGYAPAIHQCYGTEGYSPEHYVDWTNVCCVDPETLPVQTPPEHRQMDGWCEKLIGTDYYPVWTRTIAGYPIDGDDTKCSTMIDSAYYNYVFNLETASNDCEHSRWGFNIFAEISSRIPNRCTFTMQADGSKRYEYSIMATGICCRKDFYSSSSNANLSSVSSGQTSSDYYLPSSSSEGSSSS